MPAWEKWQPWGLEELGDLGGAPEGLLEPVIIPICTWIYFRGR